MMHWEMHTDQWKQAHNKAHIFFEAYDGGFDAQIAKGNHDVRDDGDDYKLDYDDGVLDWYTNFPNQDNNVPNLGKTCLFSMVHLATELERIFPIKCNALLTHNSALRRNGMRQSELNVNLHKKGRLWSTPRPESGVNNDMISRKNVISISKLQNLPVIFLFINYTKNEQMKLFSRF